MNFMMGFILLVNGGEEEDAFNLFVKILDRERGIYGFYEEEFPLYFKYLKCLEIQMKK